MINYFKCEQCGGIHYHNGVGGFSKDISSEHEGSCKHCGTSKSKHIKAKRHEILAAKLTGKLVIQVRLEP